MNYGQATPYEFHLVNTVWSFKEKKYGKIK